jgi:hemolysin III
MTADRYSIGEEIANAITHGIGALLSIAGLAVLVSFAALYGDAWHVVSTSIFGATLVLLYAASTVYHSVWHHPTKRILQRLDH